MRVNSYVKTLFLTTLVICTTHASLGYNVWLGSHEWPGAGAANKDQWDEAISKIDGVNYVLSPNNKDKATPTEWKTMIKQIPSAIPGMAEVARSQLKPAGWRTLEQRVELEFTYARNYGFEINTIMLYDEAKNGTVYEWTIEEIQQVRDYLDSKGRSSVKIAFDLRNFAYGKRLIVRNSLVDEIMIEASATRWVNNRFNLHALLNELVSRSDTKYKNIYFQIPRSESSNNQYVETRRALMTIKELAGDTFMRSSRAIFLVCNYSSNLDFYPETVNNESSYVNSLTGIALSLIEQRDVFEGLSGVLDEAFCASYDRSNNGGGGNDSSDSNDLNKVIKAVDYDAESNPYDDSIIRNNGRNIGYITNGSWVRYDDFNFGRGVSRIDVVAASGVNGGRIEFRKNSKYGTRLGYVTVTNTGGWGKYKTFSCSLKTTSGIKDLYFVFKGGSGGLLNLKSFNVQ